MEETGIQHSLIFMILDKMTAQTKKNIPWKQRKVWQVNNLSESWVIIASDAGNELWKVNIIEMKEKWVREKDITVAMPENGV